MSERDGWSPWVWVRIALVVFVFAFIFGPSELRDTVPILVVFFVALGLEVQFFVSALRRGPQRIPDRKPQDIDRDRYGFERDPDDIVVVDAEGEQVWLALSRDPELDLSEESAIEDDRPETAPRPLGAPLRRFLVGLGVIATVFVTIWFVESNTGWKGLTGDTKANAVARYSAEASHIANKPVFIRCDESRDYVGAVQHSDGVAVVGGDLAILTPEICYDLYRLAFEGETIGSRTGRALAVLAHEAWHLRGVADEGTTECYAIQTGVELGERLGLAPGRARQLMRQQLTENELRGGAALDYRVPAECRNDGRLDLRPDDSSFP